MKKAPYLLLCGNEWPLDWLVLANLPNTENQARQELVHSVALLESGFNAVKYPKVWLVLANLPNTEKQARQLLVHFVAFLTTDSICHSSLSHTVLEKVTLTTIKFRIYPHTKVDPMFDCVYISMPLKSNPYKSSATCAWSMVSRWENPP